MRRETMRRVYEYLILWWEGVGEVGRAVPEVLVMSGAVKIFTLNTALWDMSRREGVGKKEEEEERCDVLPSFLPFFHLSSSLSCHFLVPCLPSDKVGQHYTSVQHAGGEEEEDLSCERDG